MRVAIAGQQDGLEEHQGGVPDRRRAAEQRQHHLGEQGLNPEQECGAHEQCCGEQRYRADTAGCGRGLVLHFLSFDQPEAPFSHRHESDSLAETASGAYTTAGLRTSCFSLTWAVTAWNSRRFRTCGERGGILSFSPPVERYAVSAPGNWRATFRFEAVEHG